LIDPSAKAVDGDLVWDETLFDYHFDDHARRNLTDSAPFVPKGVVINPWFDWGHDRPPQTPWNETLVYEANVKGTHHAVGNGQRVEGRGDAGNGRQLGAERGMQATLVLLLPVGRPGGCLFAARGDPAEASVVG
jgi:hypothetical protein